MSIPTEENEDLHQIEEFLRKAATLVGIDYDNPDGIANAGTDSKLHHQDGIPDSPLKHSYSPLTVEQRRNARKQKKAEDETYILERLLSIQAHNDIRFDKYARTMIVRLALKEDVSYAESIMNAAYSLSRIRASCNIDVRDIEFCLWFLHIYGAGMTPRYSNDLEVWPRYPEGWQLDEEPSRENQRDYLGRKLDSNYQKYFNKGYIPADYDKAYQAYKKNHKDSKLSASEFKKTNGFSGFYGQFYKYEKN